MAEVGGYVGVASSNAYFFTNTACNDMLIYPDTSNQRILLGTMSNSGATVVVGSNSVGINTAPSYSLHVLGTDSMMIPKGTSAQRPTGAAGLIRYNTDLSTFEGYGAAWGSLGGVKDTNQDTYISPESYPTSNDDTLRFFTSNVQMMALSSNGLALSNATVTEVFDMGGNAKVRSNIYAMSRLGVATSNPAYTVHINGTDSIMVPKGTTVQRPTGAAGLIRYNTELSTFEGYGAAWGSLGGVKDTNQDTYISPESFPTSNDDTIRFYTSNVQMMTLNSNGLGINNSNPSAALDIVGNASLRGNLSMNSAVAVRGLTISKRDGTMANISTSSVAGFSNDNSGNVLSVASNNSNYSFRFLGGSTEVARLRGDGVFRLQCANLDNLAGKQYVGRIGDGAGSTGFENASAADYGASNLFGGVGLCNIGPFGAAPEGSVYFPGTAGSYAVLGRAGSLAAPSNLLPSFTIEGWFYYPANPTAAQVGQGTPAGTPLWAFGNSNGVLGLWNTFSSTGYVAGGAVAQSNWTHIAATYSGSGTKNVQLFINGALQSLTVSGAATATGSTATLTNALMGGGQDLFLGQTGGVATNMYVSSLRIVHNAVLYTSNFVPSGPLVVSPVGNTRVLLKAPLPTVTTASNTVNNVDSIAVHCIPNDCAFWMDQNGTSLQNALAGFAPSFDSNVTNSVVFNRAQSNAVVYQPTYYNIATRGFTVVSRFQFTGCNFGSNERIIDLGNGAPGSNIILGRDALGSNLVFTVYNGASAVSLRSSNFLNQNTPYVVVARYDPYSSNMSLWLNGALNSNNGPVGVGFDRLCLSNFVGRSLWSGDSNLSGNIHALAIYNRALTDKDIADCSAAMATGPGLRAGSVLDVGGGASCGPALSVRNDGSVAVNSLVGNNSTGFFPVDYGLSNINVAGCVVGNVPFLSQGPFSGEGAMCFNGGTSNAVGMYSTMFGTQWWTGGGFTCECWVNYGSFTNVVGGNSVQPMTMGTQSYTGSVTNYWSFGALGSGLLSFYYWNGALQNVTGTTVISLNTWHHIAVSYDGTSIRVFLDGNLENSAAVSGTPQMATNVFSIGWINGVSNCITGYVANPRLVYGAAVYTAAFVPPSVPVGQHSSGTTAFAIRVQKDPGRVLVPRLGGSSMVRAYPPVPLTGYYTNVQNSAYGRGGYVVTASSDLANGTYYAWYMFNNFNLLWATANTYNNTTGAYTGSTTTSDINGYPFTGEWVQIQMPVSIILTSFTLSSQNGTIINMPGSIAVLGSLDGIRWALLKQQAYTAWVAQVPTSFYVGAAQAYPYYRLVCTSKMPAGGVNQLIAIDEWVLYGSQESAVFGSDGQVGLGVSRPVQQLEVAGNAVVYGNISAGNLGMFRNRIINGDMRISQRSTTVATSGGGYYVNDRWYIFDVYGGGTTAGYVVYNKVTDAPPGFSASLQLTIGGAVSTTNKVVVPFGQPVEGYNIADLGWGTANGVSVVLSFWTKCNLTGTHLCGIISGSGATTYVTTFTVNSANTWEYKTVTIPAPPVGTTGWNTDNTAGLYVRFYPQEFGTSSTRVASVNAWQNSVGWAIVPSSGYVNTLLTSTANSAYITGVQLEKGTLATPFEFRPYSLELQLCQRYYYRTTTKGGTHIRGYFGTGFSDGATWYFMVPLPVMLRGPPTFGVNGIGSNYNIMASNGSSYTPNTISLSTDGLSDNAARIDIVSTAAAAAGVIGHFRAAAAGYGLIFDAEM